MFWQANQKQLESLKNDRKSCNLFILKNDLRVNCMVYINIFYNLVPKYYFYHKIFFNMMRLGEENINIDLGCNHPGFMAFLRSKDTNLKRLHWPCGYYIELGIRELWVQAQVPEGIRWLQVATQTNNTQPQFIKNFLSFIYLWGPFCIFTSSVIPLSMLRMGACICLECFLYFYLWRRSHRDMINVSYE